jgi:alpha-glucosidase (family GH31 glycosyl hydrolase)
MKKFILFFLIFLIKIYSFSQINNSKIFWHEDFSSGKLPDGWSIPIVGNWDPQWIVTNQPYPGSYQYQQQAPPIASKSRGYYLQFQAGYFTDEDVESWIKKKEYPDGYIVSAPINCVGKQSVILKFQQTFRWWNYGENDTAGLFVGVSTDSIHWQQWDVRGVSKSAADMFTPQTQEINISQWAANQPKIFLRFYWKGLQAWYWMIDDIELSEAYAQDAAVVRLVSNNENDNTFTKEDELVLRIKNTGAKIINTDFNITCNIDDKKNISTIVNATSNPLQPDEERDIFFPKIDLANAPIHSLKFHLNYNADEDVSNNFLSIKLNAAATSLGNMTDFKTSNNEFTFSSGITKVKVNFYRDDIFRIRLASDGIFTDPTDGDIVVNYPSMKNNISAIDKGNYILLQSKKCAVRVYKMPLHFAMYDVTDTKMIWQELKPIIFGSKTIQTLSSKTNEYFYGCGMQNGYFSHKGNDILIEKGNGWDDGGRANPAPFYMSTAGYGVFRNTFDAGKYSFKDTLRLSHNENRFDAFYFYGPSLKNILNDYTDITGKPFLMPRWALSLGDANCYNKPDRDGKAQTTPDVIWKIADKYVEHNMPRGWILPNDGYGCGYVKLDSVVNELHKRGIYTGLWTENGVEKIATEVGKYGTRICKLDVAWVGPGYKYALDGCKAAYNGIENNSDSRGFVWSVMGWAGTQRYSTVWSGDQSGNWEYIRFHIPTFIGSGLSAQNAASGDIDGIFRGSDSTYVRDLQWKCFIPVLMTMSGWAKKDKQPWVYGEPYTSINRKYLQLKMRLTPYMYTLCHEANTTGVPATRGMVLEFPQDATTWGKQTQYQFMNGEWFLVAPIYKSGGERDSIYLPKGKWIDYWNGDVYDGEKWLRNYDAPLEKLPLFVKAGAIIPMYPQMNYDKEKPADTLTLDVYPNKKSSFDMYEDDGLTRQYRDRVFATTLFEVDADKNISVIINAAKGNYNGKYLQRVYELNIHTTRSPSAVMLNGKRLLRFANFEEYQKSISGYYFDVNEKHGLLYVKTGKISTLEKQGVNILY